jgi:hypothetical protein
VVLLEVEVEICNGNMIAGNNIGLETDHKCELHRFKPSRLFLATAKISA